MILSINKDNMVGAIVIEGHVQGLSNVRSLGELGVPVYVLDVVNCLARYSKFCKKFFICPSFESESLISFLLELAKRENLRGWLLMPSNDHVVENLSKHETELSPFYKMLVPKKDALNSIIDKGVLMEIAESCGVSVPKTCYRVDMERARSFRFPLLIKGRHGLSFYKSIHAKVLLVKSFEELCQVMDGLDEKVAKDVMIQEMIPYDKERGILSFTCFTSQGDVRSYWMGKKVREHPIRFGTATMSQSVFVDSIIEKAAPLIKTLNYTGVCEVEFMYDSRDGVYKIIEINPRTWLWVGLAKACGVDYAKMVYCYVNEIPFNYPSSYEIGTKWRNTLTDFFYGVGGVLKKEILFKDYLRSLKGKIVHAVWNSQDVLPGLVFPVLLPLIAVRRR